MSTTATLLSGLSGAIGCDYLPSRSQLFFVEYSGELSRLDLVPASATIVSSGTAVVRGTYRFDFDTGNHSPGTGMDIWWQQMTETERQITPQDGAQLAYLGDVSFRGLSAAELSTLSYDTTPISGNDDATNLLTSGAVFAVRTRSGHYAKVQVIEYGYDLEIEWRTYQVQKPYQVLGTGYTHLEDIVVSSDGRHAYVTERSGNLLRVDLSDADRAQATVISSNMTAPHQIALDEARGHAYVVEFGASGRLLRIDLTTGNQTALVAGLERAIGLLMSGDGQFAYVSEQTEGPDQGRLSRIDIASGRREVLLTGMANPFFLTWSDAGEGSILTTERDPANRVAQIDLTTSPVSVETLAAGVAFRPSSVAVMNFSRLLVCCDDEINEVRLLDSVYTLTAPMFLGIGKIPVDRITSDGYANTAGDADVPLGVTDAPFGGTLPLMINHQRAYNAGARYYRILVGRDDQTQPWSAQTQPWSDYQWSTSTNRFEARTLNAESGGYYRIRKPDELWYTPFLGHQLHTAALPNGLHTIKVELYSATNRSSRLSSGDADDIYQVSVQIDNQRPRAVIDTILHHHHELGPTPVGTCGIVEEESDRFSFEITAHDPEGHLKSWQLRALWGDNDSAVVAEGNYDETLHADRRWQGVLESQVPATPWTAEVRRCAHTFYLRVWDRVIDGERFIHRETYHKSITLLLPA